MEEVTEDDYVERPSLSSPDGLDESVVSPTNSPQNCQMERNNVKNVKENSGIRIYHEKIFLPSEEKAHETGEASDTCDDRARSTADGTNRIDVIDCVTDDSLDFRLNEF